MTRAAAFAGLLLGCADDGVFVEVHTAQLAEPVDRVELLLTDRPCFIDGDACPYIQGQGFPTAMGEPGDIYLRGLGRSTNRLAGGVAVFELPAGDGLLPLGFAIARDVQGQIIGAAVMEDQLDLAGGPVIYRVDLDPVEPLLGKRDPMRAGIAEWKTGLDECIGILPVRPDRGGKPLFMVPKDNPDCDGATAMSSEPECDPFWFDGISYDPDGAAHCTMRSKVIAGEPCVLGHVPTCIENIGPGTPTCIETTIDPSPEAGQRAICLPATVCDCPETDEGCQVSQLSSSNTEPRIDCLLPAEPDITGSTVLVPCSPNDLRIALPFGGTCREAKLVEAPDTSFHSTFGGTFTDVGHTVSVMQVDEDTCTIALKWQGSLASAASVQTVLEVEVDTATATRRLWFPIKLVPTEVCPASIPTCAFVDNSDPDPIVACAQ